MSLSEGNFPFIIRECFACQHGDTSDAFGRSVFKGIRRWAPLLPSGDNTLQGDCRQADLLTVFLILVGMSARKNWFGASWMSLLSV